MESDSFPTPTNQEKSSDDEVLNSLSAIWAELEALQRESIDARRFHDLNEAVFALDRQLLRQSTTSVRELTDFFGAFVEEMSRTCQVACSFQVLMTDASPESLWLSRSESDVLKQIGIHAVRNSFAHGFAVGLRGDSEPRIELGLVLQDGELSVSFRDNGVGVELVSGHWPESSGKAARADVLSGRGVGGGAVDSLAARLQAQLRIESQPGRGFMLEVRFLPRTVGLRVVGVEAAPSRQDPLPPRFYVAESSVDWTAWAEVRAGETARMLSLIQDQKRVGIPVHHVTPPTLEFFRPVVSQLGFQSEPMRFEGRTPWLVSGRSVSLSRFITGELPRPYFLLGWSDASG